MSIPKCPVHDRWMIPRLAPTNHYGCPVNGCDRVRAAKMRSDWERKLFQMAEVNAGFDPQGPLDCAYCDNFRTNDFAELGAHVQRFHFDARGKRININVREDGSIMLPPPKVGGQSDTKGRAANAGTQLPFLKVEDMTKEPRRCKILGVDANGAGFNDIVLKVHLAGRNSFLGLKANNPNYRTLIEGLGNDETKWKDREFSIGMEYNEFYDKNYIHIFEVYPAAAAERKAKQ